MNSDFREISTEKDAEFIQSKSASYLMVDRFNLVGCALTAFKVGSDFTDLSPGMSKQLKSFITIIYLIVLGYCIRAIICYLGPLLDTDQNMWTSLGNKCEQCTRCTYNGTLCDTGKYKR